MFHFLRVAVRRNGEALSGLRTTILNSGLLEPKDKLRWLGEDSQYFEGLIVDRPYYAALTSLAGSVLTEPDLFVTTERETLAEHLKKALAERTELPLLAKALSLFPETYRDISALTVEPGEQPVFGLIFSSWFRNGLPLEPVRSAFLYWLWRFNTHLFIQMPLALCLKAYPGLCEAVSESLAVWLDRHGTKFQAGFVYRAWLDAGGALDVVEQAVLAWLAQEDRALSPEAEFVYKAWLNAGGSLGEIRAYLLTWLTHGDNATRVGADFVLKAWLAAKGDFRDVRVPAFAWFKDHHLREDSTFLSKYLVRQKQLTNEVIRQILTWCSTWPNNIDALYRFCQLGLHKHLKDPNLAEPVAAAGRLLLDTWRDKRGRPNPINLIIGLLYFLYQQPGLEDRMEDWDSDFLALLHSGDAFHPNIPPRREFQDRSWLTHIRRLTQTGRLDEVTDKKSYDRFLGWLNQWI